MARRQQQGKAIGFNTIQLFKDQILGIGSYAKVCKAKCDNLICAAKLIHETLFDPTTQQLVAPQREHRLPMRRFEQECEFLSTIRHPNIVQYLGTYRDPDTGLPALLMELMDDNLTHFLESSPKPIPYHIQVNICHDITLALSFLHSNGIIHRDLSSNNVLLIGNVRAKVTDFGMARLGNQNPRATPLTFTMCPGTDVYMPPEAVQDKPVYTEKIDCFSFGVITLQILTQEFPKPGDRRKEVQIEHPELPKGTLVEARISEVERRQNHIDKVEPNHALLQIILDCLNDRDVERPSAQQLCERVTALKDDPQYIETVMRVLEANSTVQQGRTDERDRELRTLRRLHIQQVQGLEQIIQQKDQALRDKDNTIAAVEQLLRQQISEYHRLEREKNQERERFDRHFRSISAEIEQLRAATPGIKLTWMEGEKAPCKISSAYNATVDNRSLYIRTYDKKVYCYTASTFTWSQLPDSPMNECPSVIITNFLTLVGGYYGNTLTNKLFSLTGEGSSRRWTEEFPPMPTKQDTSIVLCTGATLVVAGGRNKDSAILKTVEVLNIKNLQWSTAADLSQPLYLAPAAVCGNQIYILKGINTYTCSVLTLIQSCKSHHINKDGVWTTVAAPPVTRTTCVSINGRPLAIGGRNSLDGKPTTAIHMYNPTTDSWDVISHMATPRHKCIAAVLPNNQLMVVGGYIINGGESSDSVEFATYS